MLSVEKKITCLETRTGRDLNTAQKIVCKIFLAIHLHVFKEHVMHFSNQFQNLGYRPIVCNITTHTVVLVTCMLRVLQELSSEKKFRNQIRSSYL